MSLDDYVTNLANGSIETRIFLLLKKTSTRVIDISNDIILMLNYFYIRGFKRGPHLPSENWWMKSSKDYSIENLWLLFRIFTLSNFNSSSGHLENCSWNVYLTKYGNPLILWMIYIINTSLIIFITLFTLKVFSKGTMNSEATFFYLIIQFILAFSWTFLFKYSFI